MAALQIARELARERGAMLLLDAVPFAFVDAGAFASQPGYESVAKDLMALRDRIDGADLKYPVQVRREIGGSESIIRRVADEVRSDLIVLGTHGSGPVRRPG